MKQVNYMHPGAGLQGYATVPATSDAKEYLRLILRHKFGILLTLLLGVGLATLYLISTTPVYQSEAVIEVDPNSPLDESNVPDFTRPSIKEEYNILRSRRVLQPVVDLYELRDETDANKFPVLGNITERVPALGSWISGLEFAKAYAWDGEAIEVADLAVPRSWEDEPMTVKSLGDNRFSLLRDGRTLLESASVGERIRLDVGDNTPVSFTITSMGAREGVEFSLLRRSLESTISGVRASLATETSDTKSRMITLKYLGTDPQETTDIANQIVQVYRDVKLSADVGDTVKEREIIEANFPTLEAELRAAENALSNFRTRNNAIDTQVQTAGALGQLDTLQRELTTMVIERDELSERYTKIHPSTKRLDKEIAVIQRQINQISGRVRNNPNIERELLQLEQEVDTKRKIYNEKRERLENIRFKEGITASAVKIWDTAIVPEKPISPNKLLALVGATLGTLFLYMLYLTLRSALSTLISDQETLERASGLPVYMSIPKSNAQKRLASAPTVDPRRLLPGSSDKNAKALSNVLAVGKPEDYSVESMRGLRSMLEDVMDGAKNNVLMITSPLPSMGKSFISLNLAVLLAQSGKRVLLIDADYQRGQLHKQFGLKMGPGLPEVVRGKSELKETVKASQVENLYVIPRGFMGDGQNGETTPGSREFGRFMDVVAHRFDICVIDTPPVLSVSTAATLGKQAGSTLMVVKEGEIKEPQLAESLKRLSFSGIRVNGCILNGASAPTPRHYAYYREQID